jgi:hypothetical protein
MVSLAIEKEISKIIIEVSGGVVQNVTIPKDSDITVEIRDYDIDGCDKDRLDKDENGNYCVCSVWK